MPLCKSRDGLLPGTETGSHPGDWQLHHMVVPAGPGDFTPARTSAHHEQQISPGQSLLELLSELLLGGSSHTEPETEMEP